MIDVVAFEVDGCRGNGWNFAKYGGIDEFTEWGKNYQSMTPSPTASNISFSLIGSRLEISLSSLRT